MVKRVGYHSFVSANASVMKSIFLFVLMLFTASTLSAQNTQTVSGSVIDEASKAPLAGVTVVLLGTKPPVAVSTQADGSFRIEAVPLGRQSFKVTFVGYEDRVVPDVIVTAGKEVVLNLTIQEAVRKLNEVTVTASKAKDKTKAVNDMAVVSARSFNLEETKRYAGALGDPSRMAANFAGVVSGNDSRNDIVVRGNSPSGMLWQLEGLNIPNPNHFGSLTSTGGPVSVLNNNNIDRSDFLTSAFPAQYGNAVAGVFDIHLREGNRNKREFITQMGFNGFELGAEGPLNAAHTASYLINYRYSTLAVFQKLGINFGTGNSTPIYQDLNYKVAAKIGQRGKLSVFGVAGQSNADFLGKDVDTEKVNLYSGNPFVDNYSKFSVSANGVSYEHRLTDKTTAKLTVGYSTTLQSYQQDSISNADASVHRAQEVSFTTGKASVTGAVTHKFNAKNTLQAGVTYDATTFSLFNKEIHHGVENVYADQTGSLGLLQSYGQWRHRFSSSLSLIAGAHMQQLSAGDQTPIVEPRASIRYALNSRHAFSLGYGMHNQAQSIYTYFVQTPGASGSDFTNKDLGFTRSHHAVAGYDWNITPQMRVKLEGYYQTLTNIPVTRRPSSYSALNTGADFGVSNEDSLVNEGTGTNVGAELTVEHFFHKGYYFLITGSLFDSKYKGSDGIERNTAFNTNYVLNVLAGKEFKLGSKGSVFALNIKASAVGGRYLTPINPVISAERGQASFINELAFSDKQTDYFRVDLKAAYRKEYRRSTLEIAIDFQNLTANKNVFNQTWDTRKNTVVTQYQQGFFPVPMIRYTF
jgi:hypothetical protein